MIPGGRDCGSRRAAAPAKPLLVHPFRHVLGIVARADRDRVGLRVVRCCTLRGERLDEALGPDLARKLVFALSSGTRSRARSRSGLGARALFAA